MTRLAHEQRTVSNGMALANCPEMPSAIDPSPSRPPALGPDDGGPAGDAMQVAQGWVQSAELRDIDDLAAVQPGWTLRYEQLSQGHFHGALRFVQLPDLRLVRESASRATRQRGQIGANHVGFAMCLSPAGGGHFHGQRVDGDSIMIGRGDELDLTLREDSQLLGMVVRADLLSTLWQQLYDKPWSNWLDQKVVAQARPGTAEFVRSTHLRTMEAAMSNPVLLTMPETANQLRDAVLIEWLEAIPAMVEVRDLHSVGARQRMVDRTCDLVLGSPDRALTMLEVCKHIGSSPRRLELCFRDVLGISPHKYLRAVRLCGARRELKRLAGSGATVHDVAARWGFWHMSAFSADYKQQFGESPSVTLQAGGAAARIG